MKRTALILVLMSVLVSFSHGADTYIKQIIQNKAFVLEGQEHEAREEIIETWVGKNRLAKHGQGRSLIILLDREIIYTIDHMQKTYIEMAVPVDIHQYFPESLGQLMNQVNVSVTKTEEFQEFAKRDVESRFRSSSNFLCQGFHTYLYFASFSSRADARA